jgi:hypothetical protein
MTLEELREKSLEEKVNYIFDYVTSYAREREDRFKDIPLRVLIDEYDDIIDVFREVNYGLRRFWSQPGYRASIEYKREVVKGVLNHELLFPRIKEEISKL